MGVVSTQSRLGLDWMKTHNPLRLRRLCLHANVLDVQSPINDHLGRSAGDIICTVLDVTVTYGTSAPTVST